MKDKRIPEGFKIDYRYTEKKTRRVQLLMQPALYNAIASKAKKNGLSFNAYVNNVLEADAKSHKKPNFDS